MNIIRFSQCQKYTFLTLIFFLILRFSHFLFSSPVTYDELSVTESFRLENLLAQKSREIYHLKSRLREYKVPSYDLSELPTIYVITPTFSRLVQKAELTRLKNVFLLVPKLHWIVVEDAPEKSRLVSKFVETCGLDYTHLYKETPPEHKLRPNSPRYAKPRGVYQRNEGIRWLSRNYFRTDGIVYFADDDNTYSIDLFDEMRKTRKVAVWPVGLVGGVKVERPMVRNNKVVGWHVGWRPDRPFSTDMAGFSVNLGILLEKKALFSTKSIRGFMETDFLRQIVTQDELEPLADGCKKVLVWHTQTKNPSLNAEINQISNGDIEV